MHAPLTRLLCGAAALVLLPPPGSAQRLSDEQLLARGTTAYEALPQSVTTTDATHFANAVRYLFAYEQRSPARMRRDPAHGAQIRSALRWLSSNLGSLQPAEIKGDIPRLRDDQALLATGLGGYARIPADDRGISSRDAEVFVQSLANLYAYVQRAPKVDPRAQRAVERLERNLHRLTSAGGKGDVAGTRADWLPRGPKPAVVWTGDVPTAARSIHDLRVQRISRQEVRITFAYTYGGDAGASDLFLNAYTLGPGRQLQGIGGCCGELRRGSGTAMLTLRRPPESDVRTSQGISICMVARGRGAFHCQDFAHAIRW